MPSDGFDRETLRERESPWKDEELMHHLYHEEVMSANDIKKLFDCSIATVTKWLDKHDSITKRSLSEAAMVGKDSLNKASYYTLKRGHEMWKHNQKAVYVHRLVAVSHFGFDAVRDKHVHHKNGIPWDNREENLELHTNADHQQQHLTVKPFNRFRVAEMYEDGDASSRDLASMFDVSSSTILGIHKEFYGDKEVPG